MIKIEHPDVYGWEAAIRGMRNPMNSWDKSDSVYGTFWGEIDGHKCFDSDGLTIGKNDLDLMKRLYKGGSEHRKYLRQIIVSMDITAPLYWWKEFDTYKVGTTANSCSTMHKIHAKEFTLDDFSHEHLFDNTFISDVVYVRRSLGLLMDIVRVLNEYRENYLKTKDKTYWWQIIQLLPSSYNQKRTVTMNYENVMNMIHQRENHKLDEWREFVEILKELPYVKEIKDHHE